MLRALGAIVFVMILVLITTHMDPHKWTSATLLIGGAAIFVGIVLWIVRRAWRR